METGVCRWGILGTAGIARKNWQAIALSGNSTLTAVASRSLDRSRQFIAECQAACPLPSAPAAVGSYDELLTRPDVDAVYIPLPTGLRKEWVVRAADAGKHVLVEKPVGVTAADVRDMLAACDRNRVQFMDGVMFMHSRRLDALRRTLDDGDERRPHPPHRLAVQLQRSRRVPAGEHPRRQPARAARLPGRPRLVHHPLRAVGDEVRDADRGHRPPARRGRPSRTRSRSRSAPRCSSRAACRPPSTARSGPRTSSGPP